MLLLCSRSPTITFGSCSTTVWRGLSTCASWFSSRVYSSPIPAIEDASFFEQVRVNQELGTVSWPNDADFDSDVLYAKVTGRPIPEYVTPSKAR
jgi:hypothetical protein